MILLHGARVVSSAGEKSLDVLIDERTGLISLVEPAIEAARLSPGDSRIDCTGKFIFPGLIDPHVHIHLPFMGTLAKDTWATASRAALMGGTTTLIEMICPARSDDPLEAYDRWESFARGQSFCDYGFHQGVTRFDPAAQRSLLTIINDRNCRSLKVFLAYKGALGINDEELAGILAFAAQHSLVTCGHCENETLVDALGKQLVSAGNTAPRFHGQSRPPYVEVLGVRHLCAFARASGARVYIVHTSCIEALAAAVEERARGLDVTIEAVLPHLVLDESAMEATPTDDFAGAKYVMSPPLRHRSQLPKLWSALNDGRIATVGTDHAPFDYHTQKEMGRHDFRLIPNGIPSVEHRLDLLYSRGVVRGELSLARMIEACSEAPARIFGLASKGRIAPGLDADIVVFDPNFRGRISASTHHMATDYSAFEGWQTYGRSDLVMVRGRIMVRDGRWQAPGTAQGWGQRLLRT